MPTPSGKSDSRWGRQRPKTSHAALVGSAMAVTAVRLLEEHLAPVPLRLVDERVPTVAQLRESAVAPAAVRSWVGTLLRRYAAALSFFSLSQALVLVVTLLAASSQHVGIGTELTRWDGRWYLDLARHGYPASLPGVPSTLGFLPGYAIAVRAVTALSIPMLPAALIVARLGGLVSALFVQELTSSWWGEDAGRRATILYSLFPGTVVFSMVYSDGLFLALVTGCLLSLEKRRWVLAGGCAALATATGADGAVLMLACLVAALIHLVRTQAWHNRRQWVCLAAPALAPLGLGTFGIYLWVRLGSPLASEQAQRRFWGNHISPVAAFQHYLLFLRLGGHELNLLIGLLGIPFVVGTRYLLLRRRARPPAPALVWGFGVTGLSLVSAGLTPNPRMLLLSFPSGVVLARYSQGRRFWMIAVLSAAGLAFISWWTLTGRTLP